VAGPAWDDEITSARAEENLRVITLEIISISNTSRVIPTEDLALNWHRKMLEGITIPDDAYRGAFRGSDHLALRDYEVTVAGLSATGACDVPGEVRNMISELRNRVVTMDDLDAQGNSDELTSSFVETALDTAAWLHGEWIRIHPFVNGNGRTARTWVLWLCSRYGLPQLLPLRPRPDAIYSPASFLSMSGEHSLFYQYLLVRYNSL
jgi:Fic family protein